MCQQPAAGFNEELAAQEGKKRVIPAVKAEPRPITVEGCRRGREGQQCQGTGRDMDARRQLAAANYCWKVTAMKVSERVG